MRLGSRKCLGNVFLKIPFTIRITTMFGLEARWWWDIYKMTFYKISSKHSKMFSVIITQSHFCVHSAWSNVPSPSPGCTACCSSLNTPRRCRSSRPRAPAASARPACPSPPASSCQGCSSDPPKMSKKFSHSFCIKSCVFVKFYLIIMKWKL